jgi:hypothetical protein
MLRRSFRFGVLSPRYKDVQSLARFSTSVSSAQLEPLIPKVNVLKLKFRQLPPIPKILIGDWFGTFTVNPVSTQICTIIQAFHEFDITLNKDQVSQVLGQTAYYQVRNLAQLPESKQLLLKYPAPKSKLNMFLDQITNRYTQLMCQQLQDYEKVKPLPETIEVLKCLKKDYGIVTMVATHFSPQITNQIQKTLNNHNSELPKLIEMSLSTRQDQIVPASIHAMNISRDKFRVHGMGHILRCSHSPYDIAFAVSSYVPTVGLYENSYEMHKNTNDPIVFKETDPVNYEKAKLESAVKLASADHLLPHIGKLPQLIKSSFKQN